MALNYGIKQLTFQINKKPRFRGDLQKSGGGTLKRALAQPVWKYGLWESWDCIMGIDRGGRGV